MSMRARINDLIEKSPKEIRNKIIIYYLSYGTPTCRIVHPLIKNMDNNRFDSLWFDLITKSSALFVKNYTGFCYTVLCDIILYAMEYEVAIKPFSEIAFFYLNKETKNRLLNLMEEEEIK
jgi:hypothetical protein